MEYCWRLVQSWEVRSRGLSYALLKSWRTSTAATNPGVSRPEIVLKAGERIVLRVTARKAKSLSRDRSIALLRASDRSKVADWNLLLRPRRQEFQLTAPEPGEYVVVCTLICSEDHEGMNMKLAVVPYRWSCDRR
jgi:hypothetical protein